VDSVAGVKSLLAKIHPQCACLDLKATPMVCTNHLANAIESLEDEDEEEETENELSTQLREAKEKISALEDKLKAQERRLKEAEEKRVFLSSEHTRSSGQVINDLEPQHIALKRPAAAEAEEEAASMKKVRASSDQKFGQGEKSKPAKTNHPETALTSATPAPHNTTKTSSTTPKDFMEKTASSKSTATALPSVSASGDSATAAGQQLTVDEMLLDFKDKLSDNLLRMGNPSHVNATLQDSDSD